MSDTQIIELKPHRLGSVWDPEHPHPEGDKPEEEHVLTAADFVVDELELYGCGD